MTGLAGGRGGKARAATAAKRSTGATGGQSGSKIGGKARHPGAVRQPAAQKVVASLTFEEEAWQAGHRIIAGIDEAGRGPLAGPVVAAAVVLDPSRIPEGIADSKSLTAERREALFDALIATADVGIALSDAEQIDRDNILAATLDAMRRAVGELKSAPSIALVDGNRPPQLSCACRTIVKGDLVSLSIAAASIAAKVSRDRMMTRLDALYPGYGFAGHKGYGTAAHHAALARLGVSPLHRRSFKPVRDILEAAHGLEAALGAPGDGESAVGPVRLQVKRH